MSIGVIKWRRVTKERLVAGLGGQCNRCGYKRCLDCLHFHHLGDKRFTISESLVAPKAWSDVVEEAKKCVLLCSICHGELHAKLWDINEIKIVSFIDLKEYGLKKKEIVTGICPVCKKDVYFGHTSCSKQCAAKLANKIDWPSKEVLAEMLNSMTKCAIGRKLGVSDCAVIKKAKKLGLIFSGSTSVQESL